DWLAQVFQVAVVAYAAEENEPLVDAIGKMQEDGAPKRLAEVLTTIFQTTDVIEEDGTHTEGDTPRLRQSLQASLQRKDVVDTLAALATETLTASFDATWNDWLLAVHVHTLGAAVLEAIQQTCPQVSTEDLVVDADPGPLEDGSLRGETELWISEANPGGNGQIDQVVDAIATDGALFFRRIETALGQSEFEIVDAQLRTFVRSIGSLDRDVELVSITQSIRQADSSRQAKEGLERLRRQLVQRNQVVFHGFLVALSSRMLRPNTPEDLDALMVSLLEKWEGLELRLGVEVDARVVCALFSRHEQLDEVFLTAGFELPEGDRKTWRFNVLHGLVWARGHALRHHALPLPLRYQSTPAVTERLLLQGWLSPPEMPISAESSDWLEQLHDRLVRMGRASVHVPDNSKLSNVMGPLVTKPVQLEYMNVYPKLGSVNRVGGGVSLQVELEATV
ncbi:MAG: hypothetical protein KDA95_11380, partial [Acidimicrobiales bacterium]|nr:hypothetical protein [Acidimicrobiales bacterium]